MGNRAAVHEAKETSPVLGAKGSCQSSRCGLCILTHLQPLFLLSVPAVAKLPSQPFLSCAPLSQRWPWQFPGSRWHIQLWQCHFPAGVSEAPTERGCCWQCPRMPGEQSGSPCSHAVPQNPGWDMVGDGLGLAAFAPCLPGSWKHFSRWQLHSLCPETHSDDPEPARFLL